MKTSPISVSDLARYKVNSYLVEFVKEENANNPHATDF